MGNPMTERKKVEPAYRAMMAEIDEDDPEASEVIRRYVTALKHEANDFRRQLRRAQARIERGA